MKEWKTRPPADCARHLSISKLVIVFAKKRTTLLAFNFSHRNRFSGAPSANSISIHHSSPWAPHTNDAIERTIYRWILFALGCCYFMVPLLSAKEHISRAEMKKNGLYVGSIIHSLSGYKFGIERWRSCLQNRRIMRHHSQVFRLK